MFQKIFFAVMMTSISTFGYVAKKNVCSITINSNEEIELFKSKLSPKDFNFTELTLVKKAAKSTEGEEESESDVNQDWLMESCRQQIKCDVLIISGHFGGTFFGKSELKLPMEDLERASCNEMCSGIIKNPKEVFLFGCNTLSGKEKDSRTPEQYMQVLINDGFSHEQAQQVAAFRYSAFGSSFNDRMKRTFSGVPRIYGFTSIGPSGKTSSPLLKNYLNQTAPNYSEYVSKITPELNKPLLSAFKNTAIAQSEGEKQGNSAICYLGSPKVSTKDKLAYVDEVASKGGILQIAPHLVNFFNSMNLSDLTEPDKVQFDKIKQNENGKKQVLGFTQEPIPGLIKPQVDVLNLALKFEWLDKSKYNELLSNIALKPLYRTGEFPVESKDQICSIGIKASAIDYKRVRNENWSSAHFIAALECLGVSMDEVADIVKNSYYQKFNNSSYRSAVMSYFKSIVLSKSNVSELAQFQIDKLGDDSSKVQELLDVLIKNKYSDLGLAKKVYDLMTASKDEGTRSDLFSIYFQLISQNEEAVVQNLDYLFNSAAPIWKIYQMLPQRVMQVIASNDPILSKVIAYLSDKTNPKRIAKVLWFIKSSNVNSPKLQSILIGLLKDNSIKITAKLLILSHFNANGIYNGFIRQSLIEVYKTSQSFQITQNIIDFLLKNMNSQDVYSNLFVQENRILLKARMSQYNSVANEKAEWSYDEVAYAKELKNIIGSIPRPELEQQVKYLNEVIDMYDLNLNSLAPEITMEDIRDYAGPDYSSAISEELSAASIPVVMDRKSYAVVRVENKGACNFKLKQRDYEDECIELSSPGNNVYEIRSLIFRSNSSLGVFHYDSKAQKIDFKVDGYFDLINAVDKKIEASYPNYKVFFQDHTIDFADLIKVTPTQYKFKFNYANNARHGDDDTLSAEAIVNFKTLPDGKQTYELIKVTAGKIIKGEEG